MLNRLRSRNDFSIELRSALYGPSVQQESQATPRTLPLPILEADPSNDARSLAILAINNMSTTEIRQLAIPLGAVIDAGLLSRK
jgi:hypothetical protein